MTDLIKGLQNELVNVYQQITGKDCGAVFEDSEIIAAYEMAIEALKSKSEAEEYRTPKKPLDVIYRDYFKDYDGGCPNCGGFVAYSTHRYCPHCGQTLDWSEVEE